MIMQRARERVEEKKVLEVKRRSSVPPVSGERH